MDNAALSPWIRSGHLEEAALGSYREAFANDPAKMIVLKHVLTSDVATQLETFMADGADYSTEYGLYSRPDEPVAAEAWDAAATDDRFFRYSKLTGIRPEAALSDPTLTYMRFRAFVTEPPFKDLLEAITGVELGPGDNFGVHAFHAGDFLLDHDDSSKNRRIAFVMYLSRGWRPEYGGALFMEDPRGVVRTFDAEYNSMVVFDTLAGTTHHVGRIEAAAGDRARRTFGGWFPNPS
jgi:hypothetical protein